MAVSAHVQACIDDIMTAVYGRDVRQAIHDAVEYAVGIVGTYDSRLDTDENTISNHGSQLDNHGRRIQALELHNITITPISGTTDDYSLDISW